MKSFSSFGAFAVELAAVNVEERLAERKALELAARLIQKTAKEEIGKYQDGAGPFAAWPELADSTKADRVAKGFAENDPLLRTGELRDSIEYDVGDKVAFIGSNSDIAEYQELGTSKIPPRSFLGLAAVRSADAVEKIAGEAVTLALTGRAVNKQALFLTASRLAHLDDGDG